MTIDKFDGEHAFLSNFHPSPIRRGAEVWPTAEHLFQALKTLDLEEREIVRQTPTPGRAKRAGRRVTLRPDWEEIKVSVMREVLFEKFTQNDSLRAALLATGDAELIEGNNWNDTFWGVCNGRGQNVLGKELMDLRRRLAEFKREDHDV